MAGEVEAQIRRIVAEHLGVGLDDLAPEVSLTDDLAADSLDLFELTVVLEEHLGVTIPESALEHVRTYGEVVAVATAALARQERAAGTTPERAAPIRTRPTPESAPRRRRVA
jgi:acyl carrier protein